MKAEDDLIKAEASTKIDELRIKVGVPDAPPKFKRRTKQSTSSTRPVSYILRGARRHLCIPSHLAGELNSTQVLITRGFPSTQLSIRA